MQEREQFLRDFQRRAARATGLRDRVPQSQAQQRAIRHNSEIMSLPVDASSLSPLQDPATGTFFFMWDLSVWDSSDVWN